LVHGVEPEFASGWRQSTQDTCVVTRVTDIGFTARAAIPPFAVKTLQLEVIFTSNVGQLAPVEIVFGVFSLITFDM